MRANFSSYHKITIQSHFKCVSFTFDDAHQSAFTNGQNILEKYKKNGTYYISLSFLELKANPLTHYTIKNLISCISNGHELACHTYGHIHFYDINSKNAIQTEISKNRKFLYKTGIHYNFENFSYPFGEQTAEAKRILSEQFTTCRGIDHGINRGKIDLHNLKAIKLYEKSNSLEKIYSELEDIADKGGWLIFYTHDVQDNYSKYGCSPQYFEAAIKKCLELNIEIKAINEMTRKLKIIKNKMQDKVS